MRRAVLPTLVLAVLLGACAPATSSPMPPSPAPPATLDPAKQLRLRPLQLLKLEPGSECPRAHARQVDPAFGIAIGDGPAYAAGFSNDGVLQLAFPPATETPFYGSEWSGAKVLWLIDPSYRGPVLIRGGRLDGPEQMRFDTGANPPDELMIGASPASVSPDWRSQATYTRLSAPGCYMVQVDGTNFTETIFFEARAGS